jgi:cytochrome c oxidase subunit 1
MGKALVSRRMALGQVWTWFFGMAIFSNGMHQLGLQGAPRRTSLADARYVPDDWASARMRIALGGAILLVSLILYVAVMLRTVRSKQVAPELVPAIPVAEALHGSGPVPWWLDSFKPWLITTGILIVVAYGPQLYSLIVHQQLHEPLTPAPAVTTGG